MKTVSYSLSGTRDYAAGIAPAPDAPEEIGNTDEVFYTPDFSGHFLLDETGICEDNIFAQRAFGRA